MRFKFFDGNTGQVHTVTEWIDDGKRDIQLDQDELDLIRFEGEGGPPHREEGGKKKIEDHYDDVKFERVVKRVKRKERKRKRKNYVTFGVKM
jgi:hypothetical protein